jgi:hypothetical protein
MVMIYHLVWGLRPIGQVKPSRRVGMEIRPNGVPVEICIRVVEAVPLERLSGFLPEYFGVVVLEC